MPSLKDYEGEVDDGRNAKTIKCKYCSSIILLPRTAEFETTEFHLPLLEQKTPSAENPETELVSPFWLVNDMLTFHNVGVTHPIANTKYLTCADCEAGPIGYYDIRSKKCYVALCRVVHV